MPKKISKTLFLKVAIAIAILFVATGAMAFNDYCDPTAPAEFSDPESGFTVEFLGIDSVPEGCTGVDPITGDPIDISQCYRFKYSITAPGGDLKGLNFFQMFIPDCCGDSYVYIDNEKAITSIGSEPDNLSIFGVGQGAPDGFGANNISGYAIQGTPDNSTDWSILTNTNVTASLPAVIKVRKYGYRSFEIAGPGCSGYGEYSAASLYDERKIKNTLIRIVRAPGTGCGVGLMYSNDGGINWTSVDPEDPPTDSAGTPLVDCEGTRGRSGCLRECIVTAAASPGWTWVNLGGTWYKVYIP